MTLFSIKIAFYKSTLKLVVIWKAQIFQQWIFLLIWIKQKEWQVEF